MAQDEGGEFEEIDLFVGIGVDAEQIPEDVVEFALGGLLQHFDHEGFELGLEEETLCSGVVLVEVHFELIPNGVDEGEFLSRDVSRGINLEATAVQIDSVSEVLLDEVEILLEGNEPIIVSVQFLENVDQIFSCGLNFDKERIFSKQFNKFFKTNFNRFPTNGTSTSVFSFEDYFSEING